MEVNKILPFLSSVVMFVFTLMVLDRYRRRRGPHLLLWGIGLAMFGIGSFGEAFLTVTWNSTVFKAWYFFGAMLNAGWLGQGTVYLLARRKWANVTMAILLILSVVGLIGMIQLPLDASEFSPDIALSLQYRQIMPSGAWVRMMTPIFNIYGLITLAGGALYSAWLFWRKRVLFNRMMGNILIAFGAIVIGSASTLTRLGIGEYLYVGELIAATTMFAGFLLATRPAPEARTSTVGAPQPGA